MHKLLAIACLAAIATSAQAQVRGFINNGEQWNAATDAEQAYYVRGLNDSANFVFVDDGLDAAVAKVGRTKCLIEKRTTVATIAGMITDAYTKEAKIFSNLPPMVIYLSKVGQHCKDVINRQRIEFGLPPQ